MIIIFLQILLLYCLIADNIASTAISSHQIYVFNSVPLKLTPAILKSHTAIKNNLKTTIIGTEVILVVSLSLFLYN